MTLNLSFSSPAACQSGVLVSFTGIKVLKPNQDYLVYFEQIDSIPSGIIWFYPDYYYIKPLDEYENGVSVHTYTKIYTNYNLDNSSRSIIELSIYEANSRTNFTLPASAIYRERAHLRCGNLCATSGIPNFSTVAAYRIPSATPTHTPTKTPTPTITKTVSLTPSITPTISVTPSLTPTITNTTSPTSTPTPTNTVTRTASQTPTPSNTETVTPTPTLTMTNTPTPTLTLTTTPTPSSQTP